MVSAGLRSIRESERKWRAGDMLPSGSNLNVGESGRTPIGERPVVRKVSSTQRTARHKVRWKMDCKRPSSLDPVDRSKGDEL
jgi:hypothetical protein